MVEDDVPMIQMSHDNATQEIIPVQEDFDYLQVVHDKVQAHLNTFVE